MTARYRIDITGRESQWYEGFSQASDMVNRLYFRGIVATMWDTLAEPATRVR